MSQLLISLLTLFLLLASGFVVLIVLMQRTGQSGGMGGALGGGAAESAFGAETNDVLTKTTIYSIIIFFLISLILFLLYQATSNAQLEASAEVYLSAPATEETEATVVQTEVEALVDEAVELSTADDLFENDTAKATVEKSEQPEAVAVPSQNP